jgi:S-adenosylmethionine:tRNA ribosyltransferase-isomerase
VSALAFELPAALEAREPPEARGLARDEVRLMVAARGEDQVVHARFSDLPRFLAAGDLLVVNTSATLPAAVAARRADGSSARVHFATRAPHLPEEGWWVVEIRSADGAEPRAARRGERLTLPGGAELEIVAPYAHGAVHSAAHGAASGARLLLARLGAVEPVAAYLARHGEPIRYGYVTDRWPLEAYQTAYAQVPGSAEMPSAGRPFTPELITALVAGGVLLAPVTLHTGVSSPERHEPPYPERYQVPAATARLVNAVRAGEAG